MSYRTSENRKRFWGIRPFKRHSLVLLVGGFVYLGHGTVSMATDPTPAREEALYFAYNVMSHDSWGAVFIAAGLLAILSARWPPHVEKWGYGVLTAQAAGWSGFYVAGVLFHHGDPVSLGTAMLWGLIGFFWWAVSGLVNPDPFAHVIQAQHAENDELHREIQRLHEEE